MRESRASGSAACAGQPAGGSTISAGSITGIRKRSCGKKTTHTSIAEASQQSQRDRASAARARRSIARPRERQQQQVRHDRRHAGIASSEAYRTARSGPRCRTPSARAGRATTPGRARSMRAPRGSRAARAAPGVRPACAAPQSQLVALDRRVGGEVAFAGGERMVAGPERHAAFGRDQHEPSVHAEVAIPSTARSPACAPRRSARRRARRRLPSSHNASSRRKNRCAGRVSAARPPSDAAPERAMPAVPRAAARCADDRIALHDQHDGRSASAMYSVSLNT